MAIDHYSHLCGINYSLAEPFFSENRFDDAHVHVERAKSHAINNPYDLSRTMELQAKFRYKERKFEEAMSYGGQSAYLYDGRNAH